MSAASSAAPDLKPRYPAVLSARIVTALLQAAALYLLFHATTQPHAWPATQAWLFTPMLLVAFCVPIVVLAGIGRMPAGKLAIWAVTSTVVIIALGCHDATRGRVATYQAEELFWPWFRLWPALMGALFIAHVLVAEAVAARRLLPPYARHFDTACNLAIQAALASCFVGVFWGLLCLGAGLFKLVQIEMPLRVIIHLGFAIPASTLAFAVAVHITDVQPALIRGARSIALTLVSWLLPLLAAILAVFLCSLPFTSLEPLWRTHVATSLLLTSALALIALINACYQDGAAGCTTSRTRRLAGTIAALELLPLAGLAMRAMWLRVIQYGWTVERINGAAMIAVIACCAVGYAVAAIRSPSWLKQIEITNRVAACATVVLTLALFSPLADPARLMVADQVARLRSGAIAAAQFDYVAVRFDGARWGTAALTKLSQTTVGADALVIRTRARQALDLTNRGAVPAQAVKPATEEFLRHVAVFPKGRTLPDGFYDTQFGALTNAAAPLCARVSGGRCVVRYVTLRPGEPEALLFLDADGGSLFEQDATGAWRKTGILTARLHCQLVRQELETGDVTPAPHGWPDLAVAGEQVMIEPVAGDCPPMPRRAVPAKPSK